jgi:hypothetical protein
MSEFPRTLSALTKSINLSNLAVIHTIRLVNHRKSFLFAVLFTIQFNSPTFFPFERAVKAKLFLRRFNLRVFVYCILCLMCAHNWSDRLASASTSYFSLQVMSNKRARTRTICALPSPHVYVHACDSATKPKCPHTSYHSA